MPFHPVIAELQHQPLPTGYLDYVRLKLHTVGKVLPDGHCFCCRSPLTPTNTHVDHFVARARYPVDLGHNFVLADNKCNQQKRDRLPACEHLAAWMDRNAKFSDQIGEALKQRGIVSERWHRTVWRSGPMPRRKPLTA